MPFCIALAVRDMKMTIDEAIWAATAGGAAALRRVDIGIVAVGARADLVMLDTANPIDFVYRPGVPLVASTIMPVGRWPDPAPIRVFPDPPGWAGNTPSDAGGPQTLEDC